MSYLSKKIILLIAFIYTTPIFGFEITSEIKEGALIFGTLEKGEKLFIGDTQIKSNPDGVFFFGLPQDTEKLTLKLIKNNQTKLKNFNVQKEKWQEEYITGLQPEKVLPSHKNTERIKKENNLIKKARASFNTNYFPICFERPVKKYKRISSPFGARRILNNIKKAGHSGTDYAAPIGTKIYAPAKGIIALVHNDMFLSGKTLLINHGYGLFSSYSHLNNILVKEGDVVNQGDIIAEIGTTGRSTGPHLHYAITWMGVRLNPEQQINDFSCKKIK